MITAKSLKDSTIFCVYDLINILAYNLCNFNCLLLMVIYFYFIRIKYLILLRVAKLALFCKSENEVDFLCCYIFDKYITHMQEMVFILYLVLPAADCKLSLFFLQHAIYQCPLSFVFLC